MRPAALETSKREAFAASVWSNNTWTEDRGISRSDDGAPAAFRVGVAAQLRCRPQARGLRQQQQATRYDPCTGRRQAHYGEGTDLKEGRRTSRQTPWNAYNKWAVNGGKRILSRCTVCRCQQVQQDGMYVYTYRLGSLFIGFIVRAIVLPAQAAFKFLSTLWAAAAERACTQRIKER